MERTQQKAKPSEVKSSQQGDFDTPASQFMSSEASVLQLQRMIGNQATIQRLKHQASEPQTHLVQSHTQTISAPPLDMSEGTMDHASPLVQRQIAPIAGASSGWFRKGRRDKINAMVSFYNLLDSNVTKASQLGKVPLSSIQLLITNIEKIQTAANDWHAAVVKKTPEKAASIRQWITDIVETELTAKQAKSGELQAAEALKAASDGASYNPLYATPEYTLFSHAAGTRWLATPDLAPIFEHFLMTQREELPLNAYKEMRKYAQNPSRDEVRRIYLKYELHDKNLLNITGEGAGGIEAIEAIRAQINAVVASPSAPLPPNFGAIERSVASVINMIFSTFTATEPFRKVTTPPRA